MTVPLVLISKSARPGKDDVLDLRYGTAMDDPKPFILSVTAEHIQYQTQDTPPFTYYQMKAYVDKNADKLKTIAEACIAKGLKAETL
jgi:hypothetical protein